MSNEKNLPDEKPNEKPKRKTALRNLVFLAVTLAGIAYALVGR